MSACDKCWGEAFTRSLLRGGSTADHYRDVLAEHEARGDHKPARDHVAEADELRKRRQG